MVVARRLSTEERDRVLRLAARLVWDQVVENAMGNTKADWFVDEA